MRLSHYHRLDRLVTYHAGALGWRCHDLHCVRCITDPKCLLAAEEMYSIRLINVCTSGLATVGTVAVHRIHVGFNGIHPGFDVGAVERSTAP